MKGSFRFFLAFASGAYLSAASGSAWAAFYNFTLISEVDSDRHMLLGAAINSSGFVSFSGTPLSQAEGTYVGDGGGLTTIEDEDDPRFSSFYGTSINDAGDVAFERCPEKG
jgi:hypothetical protein